MTRLHCKVKDSDDLKDLFEGICEDLQLDLEETKKKCKVKVKVSLASICQICEANDLFIQVDFPNNKISVYLKGFAPSALAPETNEILEPVLEEQTEEVVDETVEEPTSDIPPVMEMDDDEDDLPF